MKVSMGKFLVQWAALGLLPVMMVVAVAQAAVPVPVRTAHNAVDRGPLSAQAAANADPETGYVISYTSSSSGFEQQAFYGGTSFVAPQLNGVSALLGQHTDGDNWFYKGSHGHNPAAGLGTIDVAQFAEFLQGPF